MIERFIGKQVGDLFYRLILWAGLSIIIKFTGPIFQKFGAYYVQSASAMKPNMIYWNVMVGVGIILLIISVSLKEFAIGAPGNTFQESCIGQLAFFVSKCSADLILAGYNVCCFIAGWFMYELVFKHSSINAIGTIILIQFTVFSSALGLLSIVARAKPESRYISWWFSELHINFRIACYLISTPAMIWLIAFWPIK